MIVVLHYLSSIYEMLDTIFDNEIESANAKTRRRARDTKYEIWYFDWSVTHEMFMSRDCNFNDHWYDLRNLIFRSTFSLSYFANTIFDIASFLMFSLSVIIRKRSARATRARDRFESDCKRLDVHKNITQRRYEIRFCVIRSLIASSLSARSK